MCDAELDPSWAASDDSASSCSDNDLHDSDELIQTDAKYLSDDDDQAVSKLLEEPSPIFTTQNSSINNNQGTRNPEFRSALLHDESATPANTVLEVTSFGARTCEAGLEATETTPVADLLKDERLDVTQTQVQAVPIDRRFYDQWARLPREEDPEQDVIYSSRRPFSLRMLPATGSLKSYTLMSAIVRDKQSSIQNLGDFTYPLGRSSVSEGGSISDGINVLTENCVANASFTSLPTRNSFIRSDEGQRWPNSRTNETFHFIPNYRAKTAPEKTCVGDSPNHFLSKTSPKNLEKDDRYTGMSWLTQESREKFFRDIRRSEKKSELKRPPSRHWRLSSITGSLSASPAARQLNTLSMNTASLMFSADIDLRDERYRRCLQKPRPAIKMKQPASDSQLADAREGSRTPTASNDNREKHRGICCSGSRMPEMTCVEFMDLAEVGHLLQRQSSGPKPIERRPTTPVYAHLGSVSGSRLAVRPRIGRPQQSSRQPCCDKPLISKQFVTIGVPLRACSNVKSAIE